MPGMNDYAFIPPYCFSKDCKTSKDVLWGLFYNRNLTSLEGSGDLNGGVVSDKVQRSKQIFLVRCSVIKVCPLHPFLQQAPASAVGIRS